MLYKIADKYKKFTIKPHNNNLQISWHYYMIKPQDISSAFETKKAERKGYGVVKWGKICLDKNFIRKNPVDPRLFGGFIEHLGDIVYNGIYDPSHPDADRDGFRQDVINLVRELKFSGIRYPGGNFVCPYRWEDTVGPVQERPVRLDLAWRQTEPNTVGLAEFEKWVKAVGSELIMTVNLSTRGALDAANLVEYCNHPQGSFYSDLRREHGHEEPYRIRLWCMGNEVDGAWNLGMKKADVYAWDAREAAKAVKRVDNSLELIAVGSSGTQLDTYLEWDRTVLETVYEEYDYISLHRYMGMKDIDAPDSYDRKDTGDYLELAERFERNIQDVIAACDYVKGRKHSQKTMYISADEYNVIDIDGEDEEGSGKPQIPWQIGPAGSRKGMTMKSTLLFGLTMIKLFKYSHRVKIACQSFPINSGGNGLILCEKNGKAWVNGSYYIFRHCSLYGRGNVMEQEAQCSRYDTASFKDAGLMDSVCVYHEESGELDIFVVNKSAQELEISVQTACFGALTALEHLTVEAGHIMDRNSAEERDKIREYSKQDIQVERERIKCILTGYSWNVLRVRERKEIV